MTATLTDRYVWAVARTQPFAARAALEATLRERIADAMDVRRADGVRDDVLEQIVLTELGDPDVLAAQYIDRPLQLIGPRSYVTWRRLLRLLLVIVIPSVTGAVILAQLIAGAPVGEVIGNALWIPFSVGVQLCFWVTLAFAIIDRVPSLAAERGPWTIDRLPDLPPYETARASRGDFIASAVMLPLVALFVALQQLNPFLRDESGEPIALFDPQLWSFWLPYLFVLTALEFVFALALYLAGRWNLGLALVNIALNVAFCIPVVWLIATGQLINPAFIDAVGLGDEPEALRIVGIVLSVALPAVAAWDVIEGFLRLSRARRLAPDAVNAVTSAVS